eukprot:UN05955
MEKPTDKDVDEYFKVACELVKQIKNMTQENQLYLYGLYKQSTQGPCLEDEPQGLFNYEKTLKWGAWKKFSDMPPRRAKLQYIDLVIHFAEEGGDDDINPDR